jgi:hypothetical protein
MIISNSMVALGLCYKQMASDFKLNAKKLKKTIFRSRYLPPLSKSYGLDKNRDAADD